MSKESALIFLGIFVIIVPFLGFPNSVRTVFLVASGLLVSFIALLVYARERLMAHKKMSRRSSSSRHRSNKASGQGAQSHADKEAETATTSDAPLEETQNNHATAL